VLMSGGVDSNVAYLLNEHRRGILGV